LHGAGHVKPPRFTSASIEASALAQRAPCAIVLNLEVLSYKNAERFARIALSHGQSAKGDVLMRKVRYKVLRHDAGWAYEANGTYSETFPTREAARKAARFAAYEQLPPGESTLIDYEDETGTLQHEIPDTGDRPKTRPES
jgi:hypothetical protein